VRVGTVQRIVDYPRADDVVHAHQPTKTSDPNPMLRNETALAHRIHIFIPNMVFVLVLYNKPWDNSTTDDMHCAKTPDAVTIPILKLATPLAHRLTACSKHGVRFGTVPQNFNKSSADEVHSASFTPSSSHPSTNLAKPHNIKVAVEQSGRCRLGLG
jgi:hypothetical protein